MLFRQLAPFILLTCMATPSLGDASETSAILDGLSQINYDSEGKFTIGDSIASDDLGSPKSRCVSYDADKDIVKDTGGAIESFMRISLVRNYEDAESNLNFSFSYHAAAKAKFGDIASGGSSLTATGRYENFFKNRNDSMILIIEAYANHGRDIIENWNYKEEYKKLINDNKFEEFQQKCGDYFIRAKRLVSKLRVTFNFSGLQKQSKMLIASSFKGTSQAGIAISGLSAEAQNEMSFDLSKTLSLARRLGKVTSSSEATGGTGIKTVSNILAGVDVNDSSSVAGLIKGLLDASSDLVRANAAPDLFIIVPYPDLAGTIKPFDSQDYAALGSIFKALMRVDEHRAIYSAYKERDEKLWARYFSAYAVPLDDMRKKLVVRYIDCRKGKDCKSPIPSAINGILLTDVLYDGQLSADCPRSFTSVERTNPITADEVEFLSSINIYWKGKLRFIDEVDLPSLTVLMIGPDMKIESNNLKIRDYLRTWGEAKDYKNMMALIHTRTIDASKAADRDGKLDYNYLVSERNKIATSIFSLKFRLNNGIELEEVLGMPNMKNCRPGG